MLQEMKIYRGFNQILAHNLHLYGIGKMRKTRLLYYASYIKYGRDTDD
jgi:hypothetical protein